MNAKKFTLTFLLLFIVSYALLYLLYVMVNPEQIYNGSITEKKFFYTKEYSRKQYEALKKKKYVLVFGTSQIHRISSKMLGKDLLNMHNLYGEPGDILNFLYQLDQKQISNIDEIFYLIDLRAGATRIDRNLIDYGEHTWHFTPLTLTKLKRLYIDVANNYGSYKAFLRKDGSTEHIDPTAHIRRLPDYPYKVELIYNDTLIKGILDVNRFAKKHRIKITFFTPVTNTAYFKKIDFLKLKPFFSALLKGGIKSIKMFYFVSGLSDAENESGEPVSFLDSDHLNQYYVNIWLKQYILTDSNIYTIHNQRELEGYIKKMLEIQKNIKTAIK
jgi:hypothetical protein